MGKTFDQSLIDTAVISMSMIDPDDMADTSSEEFVSFLFRRDTKVLRSVSQAVFRNESNCSGQMLRIVIFIIIYTVIVMGKRTDKER